MKETGYNFLGNQNNRKTYNYQINRGRKLEYKILQQSKRIQKRKIAMSRWNRVHKESRFKSPYIGSSSKYKWKEGSWEIEK